MKNNKLNIYFFKAWKNTGIVLSVFLLIPILVMLANGMFYFEYLHFLIPLEIVIVITSILLPHFIIKKLRKRKEK